MVNTLQPFIPSEEKPWDHRRVQHLYQRLGYGTHFDALSLDLSPSDLVDQLIDGVLQMPAPEPPYWAFWTNEEYPDEDTYFEVKDQFFRQWLAEAATPELAIRNKLALFWHNHFVAEEEVYGCNAFMWSYYYLIHTNVLGNFRSLVEEMGKNPAMLVYLNGNQNVAEEPNENYARELMELFTMGENNGYTQDDIVEVARALTGWRVEMYACDTTVSFDASLFDNSSKTIFNQAGNFGYDDVHELIFFAKATEVSEFICGKLYRFFVYDEIDTAIVQEMAATFRDNNWDIAPVLRQLLKSEHFFEDRFIGARIKSPIECLISLIHKMGAAANENYDNGTVGYLTYGASELGQEVFNPVDVAGWQEHRTWLTENTLTARWGIATDIMYTVVYHNDGNLREPLRALAISLTDTSENDPEVITQALATYFLNRPLPPDQLAVATLYFKGEIPENYFEDGTWTLYYGEVPEQIANLLTYLIRLPEWQLC
ncbi:MAG: DUF1800 domain-containing protein [Chitinophagales bacterium]|nr:DUF1800 domain-containing protein [Chitinophagales bacterium]